MNSSDMHSEPPPEHGAAPPISIGMPLYNGARFLPAALDSLLAQTCGDFELIISDNGSSDGSREICLDYARRDSRIRISHHEENRGAAWNFNFVLSQARGELFKWAACDDLLGPRCLEACRELLERSGAGTVLACPRTMLIDEQGAETGPYDDRMAIDGDSPARRLGLLVRNLRRCNVVFGLIRRRILAETGGIRPLGQSDHLLLAELILRGRFAEVPEVLFYRRIHPDASTERYPGLVARARWFDPHRRSRAELFPITRLALAHLGLILAAPLPVAERSRALATFLGAHAFLRYDCRRAQLVRGAYQAVDLGRRAVKARRRG